MRLFQKRFLQEPDKIKELSEKDFYRKKEGMWSIQLGNLQLELADAKRQLIDYENVQAEMEEAQKTIEDLQASLDEYRTSSTCSQSQLDQLNQDVNFYRQESAIYEGKNTKMQNKLQKLKTKNSLLVDEKKQQASIQKLEVACQVDATNDLEPSEVDQDLVAAKDK